MPPHFNPDHIISRAIRQKSSSALTYKDKVVAFITPYDQIRRIKITGTADLSSELEKAPRVTEQEAVQDLSILARTAHELDEITIIQYGDMDAAAIIPERIYNLINQANATILPGERIIPWNDLMKKDLK